MIKEKEIEKKCKYKFDKKTTNIRAEYEEKNV